MDEREGQMDEIQQQTDVAVLKGKTDKRNIRAKERLSAGILVEFLLPE